MHLSISVVTCTVVMKAIYTIHLHFNCVSDDSLVMCACLGKQLQALKLTTRLNKGYSHLHLIAFSNRAHIETRWMNKISSGMTEISSSQISGQQNKLHLYLMYLFRCRSKNKPPCFLIFLPTTTPHLAEAARRQWGLWIALDCPPLHPVVTTP